MTKAKANPVPLFPPSEKPMLPCPTSPMQQTDSEAWEHTRDMPRTWDQYRNDHIDDRADYDCGED
jgi:hypothetical protein